MPFQKGRHAAAEFTTEMTDRIWTALGTVLTHHGRRDVRKLVIELSDTPLPVISPGWRLQAAKATTQTPGNQARRERAKGGYPVQDDLVFGSQAELAVYNVLMELQRDFPVKDAFAVLPLPGARLRDDGVRTPDFVVIAREVSAPGPKARRRQPDRQQSSPDPGNHRAGE